MSRFPGSLLINPTWDHTRCLCVMSLVVLCFVAGMSPQTLKLLRLRLEHSWDASLNGPDLLSSSSASAAGTIPGGALAAGVGGMPAPGMGGVPSESAVAAAAAVASAHTCPYTGVAAVRVSVFSPGKTWCGRGDWRYHLLNVAQLDPYT